MNGEGCLRILQGNPTRIYGCRFCILNPKNARPNPCCCPDPEMKDRDEPLCNRSLSAGENANHGVLFSCCTCDGLPRVSSRTAYFRPIPFEIEKARWEHRLPLQRHWFPFRPWIEQDLQCNSLPRSSRDRRHLQVLPDHCGQATQQQRCQPQELALIALSHNVFSPSTCSQGHSDCGNQNKGGQPSNKTRHSVLQRFCQLSIS
jgi:hypothetical protein